MLSRSRLFAVALLVGVWTVSASAATVTFTLDLSGAAGTFTLTAGASAGDNGGIASYGIPLTGVATLNHRSPFIVSSANFAPSGFSNLRSADDVANVFAGQALTGPAANYLYGIGQSPNSFAGLGIPKAGAPDPTADEVWVAPVVIATGTYAAGGTLPSFLPPTADLFSNLFTTSGDSANKIGATVNTIVIPPGGGGDIPVVTLVNIGERELSAGTIVQALSATNGPITNWGSLVQTSGPAVALAPTLGANGTFTWNPAGSLAGKKGSGQVVYEWSAIATNATGPSGLVLRSA